MRGKYWTTKEIRFVLDKAREGWPHRTIAIALDRTINQVTCCIWNHGSRKVLDWNLIKRVAKG